MSRIPGFRTKNRAERLAALSLSDNTLKVLESDGGIKFGQADRMIENALGVMSFPLGVATNFVINGRERLVPMVIEEPSVVAAASKSALAARKSGGFTASYTGSISMGQIQVLDAAQNAENRIMAATSRILKTANACSRSLPKEGRGAKAVSCRRIKTPSGVMLIVEIEVDVGDAMGANITNTMCEAVSPIIEEVSGGRALLRILSNYSTCRLAMCSAVFLRDVVGADVIYDIIRAYEFADYDVYRAVTHNKGTMNGIIAVATATGQDSRAIEAAAHAWAARTGRYRSLTEWSVDKAGNLQGSISVPMPVGTVGGVINVHPTARACLDMAGIAGAEDMACMMAAAGLAQNFGAMRALATDGIQKGHMRLHARNVAAAAGVPADMIDHVAQRIYQEGDITAENARRAAGLS